MLRRRLIVLITLFISQITHADEIAPVFLDHVYTSLSAKQFDKMNHQAMHAELGAVLANSRTDIDVTRRLFYGEKTALEFFRGNRFLSTGLFLSYEKQGELDKFKKRLRDKHPEYSFREYVWKHSNLRGIHIWNPNGRDNVQIWVGEYFGEIKNRKQANSPYWNPKKKLKNISSLSIEVMNEDGKYIEDVFALLRVARGSACQGTPKVKALRERPYPTCLIYLLGQTAIGFDSRDESRGASLMNVQMKSTGMFPNISSIHTGIENSFIDFHRAGGGSWSFDLDGEGIPHR